ncbi:hypothetical protein [Clostridium sp. C2-6-12]|uniref:hypothetical protein n=1 Tax=Clostridium sp. C2-6-12 TaxID=2698832 RepID=UPI00136CF312|nr:hypothetical protein [Clostridium sp. C2-6-12]
MEKQKITPKQISETLGLVDNAIEGINNCIRYVTRYKHNVEGAEFGILALEKEKKRLEEQLETFENTDVEIIKNTVYDKEFATMIQDTLYGRNEIVEE